LNLAAVLNTSDTWIANELAEITATTTTAAASLIY